MFNRFAERHPPSPADPHVTTSAYLRSHGLDPAPLLRQGVFAQGRQGVEGEDGTWRDYPSARFSLRDGAACHRLAFLLAGRDWNDLLLFGELTLERIEQTINEAIWRGELEVADSAEAYFTFVPSRVTHCDQRGGVIMRHEPVSTLRDSLRIGSETRRQRNRAAGLLWAKPPAEAPAQRVRAG